MSWKNRQIKTVTRRQFTEDFKRQAVQLLLDGHSASSIFERLCMSGRNNES